MVKSYFHKLAIGIFNANPFPSQNLKWPWRMLIKVSLYLFSFNGPWKPKYPDWRLLIFFVISLHRLIAVRPSTALLSLSSVSLWGLTIRSFITWRWPFSLLLFCLVGLFYGLHALLKHRRCFSSQDILLIIITLNPATLFNVPQSILVTLESN